MSSAALRPGSARATQGHLANLRLQLVDARGYCRDALGDRGLQPLLCHEPADRDDQRHDRELDRLRPALSTQQASRPGARVRLQRWLVGGHVIAIGNLVQEALAARLPVLGIGPYSQRSRGWSPSCTPGANEKAVAEHEARRPLSSSGKAAS